MEFQHSYLQELISLGSEFRNFGNGKIMLHIKNKKNFIYIHTQCDNNLQNITIHFTLHLICLVRTNFVITLILKFIKN